MTIHIPDMVVIVTVAIILVTGGLGVAVPIGDAKMPTSGKVFALLMIGMGVSSTVHMVVEALR